LNHGANVCEQDMLITNRSGMEVVPYLTAKSDELVQSMSANLAPRPRKGEGNHARLFFSDIVKK
jgi:hypothetical protein